MINKNWLNKYNISEEEAIKYELPREKDYLILGEIIKLEQKQLSDNDRIIIEFCKSQLLNDWRAPLLEKVNEISIKYNSEVK